MPLDVKRARKLYRAAAAATGGTVYVYQPSVKKGVNGGLIAINMGPVELGLTDAKVRLVAINAYFVVKVSNSEPEGAQ